jgi:hypothetical protein
MQQPSQPGQPTDADLQSMDQETGDSAEELSKEDLETQWYKHYAGLPYKELAERMVELKKQAAEADRINKALNAEFDVIRLRVVPERFAADGMSSLRITGVGRLGLTSDAYCNQIADNQEELFELLRELDLGGLIKETVNPSSLKSAVKEMYVEHLSAAKELDLSEEFGQQEEEGKEETDFERISKLVRYTPFMRASVTKG